MSYSEEDLERRLALSRQLPSASKKIYLRYGYSTPVQGAIATSGIIAGL
jgi:hypothetical protein